MSVQWREVDGRLRAFLGKQELTWCPQAGSQAAFLACPYFEALYEGTRGPGKTDGLIMDFAQHCGPDVRSDKSERQVAGWGAEWRGILFRQTYPQLADVIAKTKKWLPLLFPGIRFNEAAKTWTWTTGEELYLRHMSRVEDYWNYHGHQYPWIAFEELTTWASDECYRKMMSCSRSTMPNMPRKYRGSTNPYGPGHGWVKKRFGLTTLREGLLTHPYIRYCLDEETGTEETVDKGPSEPLLPNELERIAVRGRLSENRILLHADPGYPARIAAAARNDAERRAWLEGDWDVVAGGMFDDVFYEMRNHIVVDPFEVPETWTIDRSFDWGSSKPFSVGWWAESDGSDYKDATGRWRASRRGDLFRIAEWYGTNGQSNEGLRLLAADVARGIVEREVRWGLHGRVRRGVADSSIFNDEDGPSIADNMSQSVRVDGRSLPGVQWEKADKRPGSRKQGWEQVRKMLWSTGPKREAPGLFVFSTCRHFLEIIPGLPRDPKDPDDLDTKSEDHIADEVRYRVRFERPVVRSGRTIGAY